MFTGWRKSRASSHNGACVEVSERAEAGIVAVRDTQDREGIILVFPAGSWREFTASFKTAS